MRANLENSAVATGLEKVFLIPKKGNAKKMLKLPHIALISHASKIMFKILQVRLQVNLELPDVQSGFGKAEGPEIKVPVSFGSSRKQESS